MSGNIQAMRERRNALAKETRNLLDKNTQGAEWNADSQKKYDELIGQIENIDASIAREQRLLDLSAENHFKAAGGRETEVTSDARKLFNKLVRVGESGLSAEERAQIHNTMSTTTPGEGGYTVQTEVAKSILDALKSYGGMREVAEVIRTAKGNPMNWPTSDGTAEEGELIAENGSASSQDASFGVKSVPVYKFGSKIITVPIELLQDGEVDIEAFLKARIVTRLGRITNRLATLGTGSGEPTGLITAASVGKAGTTGNVSTITYDDLVDLEHSVDPAYRGANAGYMFADSTLKVIRKIKDSQGRPIFVPGYEQGPVGSSPSTLMGRKITINQSIAAMAASAKSIAFGDFSYYKIRDAMDMSLFRFTDSVYTSKGQVGFLAWLRSGGNLVDVGGAVKLYQNSAT